MNTRTKEDTVNAYTTRTEAIQREIIDPIEAGDATASEFDIDAIADEVIVSAGSIRGNPLYECSVTPEEFWQIVERHAL